MKQRHGVRPAPRPPDPFGKARHNHHDCLVAAVDTAERLCALRGVRLTPLRRRVLELIWRSHDPIGAYAVLDALREGGRSAAPPTVYRALEFLTEQGFVHRIESRNAYVGCAEPEHGHASQFLICGRCGAATELKDGGIQGAIGADARRLGFQVQHVMIEAIGLCPSCSAARAAGVSRAGRGARGPSTRRG
ncbi:MAG TPA: transcriptional repressor [Alphaproteobacteria bacterium]|nr:transcriptional repressor [Alphaproteobacteria bacterium]